MGSPGSSEPRDGGRSRRGHGWHGHDRPARPRWREAGVRDLARGREDDVVEARSRPELCDERFGCADDLRVPADRLDLERDDLLLFPRVVPRGRACPRAQAPNRDRPRPTWHRSRRACRVRRRSEHPRDRLQLQLAGCNGGDLHFPGHGAGAQRAVNAADVEIAGHRDDRASPREGADRDVAARRVGLEPRADVIELEIADALFAETLLPALPGRRGRWSRRPYRGSSRVDT